MALFAFPTFGVMFVPPPLPGAACTPWSQALWWAQGTGSGSGRVVPAQRGFCSHGLTRVTPVQQDTPLFLPDITAELCASLLAAIHSRRGALRAPKQPLLGHLCPSGPGCTLQSSGLGCIQHGALQPAGSPTAPAPAAAA